MTVEMTVTAIDTPDDNLVNARSHLSFQLNFMLLMFQAGRDEAADEHLRKLAHAIQSLPEDLFISINQGDSIDA